MSTDSYRFNVGDFECIAISDGSLEVPASFMFSNAPAEALAQALRSHNLHPDRIAASLNCLIINTGQHLLLLDTGMGAGHEPSLGNLRHNLGAVGIEPGDIDWVILSHGHPDHIGGNIGPDGLPAYPNARYSMWQDEWEFWTSEANLAAMAESYAATVRKNLLPIEDHVELIASDTELVPGVKLISAAGHTPGHMGLLVSSQQESLLGVGDAVGHPLNLKHPDWYVASDMNHGQVLATRRLLYEQAVTADALVFSNHFIFPGLGRVTRADGAWQWQPVEVRVG